MRTKNAHTATSYKFGPALLAEIAERGSCTVERAHEISREIRTKYEPGETSWLITELKAQRKIRNVNGELVKV